jgi:hypothetical protein
MWNDLGQPCRVIILSEFVEVEVGEGNKLRKSECSAPNFNSLILKIFI